jgi:ABC-2 type transport system permease protein
VGNLKKERKMSIKRISGILLQEYYITKRSLEVMVDVVFFPLINIIVFGFLSLYLSGKGNPESAYPLLLGMILWQLLYITQYSISVGSLWSIWSRNLSNLFISPISVLEYNVAFVISGSLKAFIVFLSSAVLSLYIFHFNIFQLGFLNLLLFFINMVLFGISTGLIIIGLIFRYGTRIQALAWGVTFLFQPLTAAFFPVSVLPFPLREIAYLFPATYVFEAARAAIHNPTVNWQLIGIALIENAIYMIVCTWIFKRLFAKSKEIGQFARNEG